MLNRKVQELLVGDLHLNVDEEDMDTIKGFMVKIQMKNKTKIGRRVVIDCDRENELDQGDEKRKEYDEAVAKDTFTKVQQDAKIEVEAMVHQADSDGTGGNEKLPDSLVQNNTTDLVFDLNPEGGAKPKIPKRFERNQNEKARGKQNARKMNKAEGKNRNQAKVRWGSEESSESDGGWDMDGGDIPLLPRW